MNTINEFKTNFIENLEQTLFEITANRPLTRIYVSIGSKLNENVVVSSRHKDWHSNALYQMFPTFLQNNSNHTTLIVIIDKFTSFEYNRNELVLLNRLKKTKHTHIVVFNTLCTEKLLYPFVNYLTHMCKQHEIHPTNLLICNYVKFISIPNAQERQYSFFISSFIAKLLDKTNVYSNCLYEWFGYDYSLFNMIYKYNLSHNLQDNNGYVILKRIMNNYPSEHLYQTKINNIEVCNLCEHMIDITKIHDMNSEILTVSVSGHLQ